MTHPHLLGRLGGQGGSVLDPDGGLILRARAGRARACALSHRVGPWAQPLPAPGGRREVSVRVREGVAPHSWTSQISDSRGGSFLSWSRRANTCSECTELSVRKLTSFISIRGKRSRSCGHRRQVGAGRARPVRCCAADLDHRGPPSPGRAGRASIGSR